MGQETPHSNPDSNDLRTLQEALANELHVTVLKLLSWQTLFLSRLPHKVSFQRFECDPQDNVMILSSSQLLTLLEQ